jgi:hypothetical protein
LPEDIKLYDAFNREERAICAHLFRLLHENSHLKEESPLGKFISLLDGKNLTFCVAAKQSNKLQVPLGGNNRRTKGILNKLDYSKNTAIYCEVALIRDYYNICNTKEKKTFLNKIIQIVDNKQNICKSVRELKGKLKNNKLPHPSRIKYNFKGDFNKLSPEKKDFYNTLQGVFNAKPDIAITVDNVLLVGEAKLTEPFTKNQLVLTKIITQVWAELLYKNLGFDKPPKYKVFKLGKTNTCRTKITSDISWTDVLRIAEGCYPVNDRSLIALKDGTKLKN